MNVGTSNAALAILMAFIPDDFFYVFKATPIQRTAADFRTRRRDLQKTDRREAPRVSRNRAARGGSLAGFHTRIPASPKVRSGLSEPLGEHGGSHGAGPHQLLAIRV